MNKLLRILLALLLVATLVLGVVACGEEDTPADDTTPVTDTTDNKTDNNNNQTPTPTPTPDPDPDPDPTPDDPNPDDPNPDDPNPDDPNPDDPNPDDPNPDDPNPDDPNPDDPNPDEPNPDEPNPDEPNPDEPNPDEPNPDEPNPEPGNGTWTEYNVGVNTTGIKLLGERNATKASDGRIWLDWAGSGIEMNVRLNTTFDVRLFVQAMADEGTCTFAIYVDGNLFGNGYYTIACGVEEQFIDLKNVPAGNHIIRIVKVTDYTMTSAEILMISMDGEFLATPEDKDLYIEFIGDAITTGYEDVTQSYAWLVANAFNADYAITALNGYGLVNGSAEVGSGSMLEAYEKINPLRDSMTNYRFEREADVVVINLGAEDYYYDEIFNGDYYPETFQAAYEEFLDVVRYWNPNAKILCVYGAANDGYADAVLAAVEAVGGEDAGIWTLALDLTEEEADDGINVPSADEQAAYADLIGKKINEIKDVVIAGDEPVVGPGEIQDWNA